MQITNKAIKSIVIDFDLDKIDATELGKVLANLDDKKQAEVLNACAKEMKSWSNYEMDSKLCSIADNINGDTEMALYALVSFKKD